MLLVRGYEDDGDAQQGGEARFWRLLSQAHEAQSRARGTSQAGL